MDIIRIQFLENSRKNGKLDLYVDLAEQRRKKSGIESRISNAR